MLTPIPFWHGSALRCITLNIHKTMRTSINIIAFAFALVVWQACGPKSNEATADMKTETATAEKEAEMKKENAQAKWAKIEQARIEKAEQRRLAAIEKAKATPSYKDANGKIIYYKTEVDPTFPGGDNAMMKYLNDNISYPQRAQDNGIEGTVFVDFVVDEKGNVTQVNAADFVGDQDQSLMDESMRVVKSMPVWVAGKQNGKTVATAYSLPVTFRLAN